MRRPVYHGWWQLLTLSLTETVSFGVLYYGYTVFVAPMQQELQASAGTIAGAFALGTVVSGLAAAPYGRWLDRHGVRGLMSVGALLAGLLLMAWSMVQTVPQLYLVWTLMGLTTAALYYEPAFALLTTWFKRHRNLAFTVLTFSAGFASVIFLPLIGWLNEALGWRETLRWLALLMWAVPLPLHALVLRRRPEDLGQSVDGLSEAATGTAERAPVGAPAGRRRAGPAVDFDLSVAMRTGAFRWLTLSFACSGMIMMAMGVHLVPLLQARGLSPTEAAALGGLIGLTALPGRLLLAPLASVVSTQTLMCGVMLCQAIGLSALWLWPGGPAITVFVLLYGAGFGVIAPLRASLLAETFGPRWYGTISGRMVLIGTPFRAGAPVLVGFMLELGAGWAFATLVFFCLVASLAVLPARR